MARRTLTALVGLPVLFAVVWFGFPWVTIAVSAIALVGWWEYHRMFSSTGHRLILIYGGLWTVALVLTGHLGFGWTQVPVLVLLFAVLGGGTVLALRCFVVVERVEKSPHGMFLAVGPVYVGFLLAHAVALRGLEGDGDVDEHRGLRA